MNVLHRSRKSRRTNKIQTITIIITQYRPDKSYAREELRNVKTYTWFKHHYYLDIFPSPLYLKKYEPRDIYICIYRNL
jgi:hypothetical protein